MKPPAIIFVIGFHRSGSSMATGIFHHLGYNVGPEADRIPTDDWNKKGYFEQLETMKLNDIALGLMGGSWYKPPDITPLVNTAPSDMTINPFCKRLESLMFSNNTFKPIVVKDPRLALTWPLWKKATRMLLSDAGHYITDKYDRKYRIVFIGRHPYNSISSMVKARVGGMTLDYCIELYGNYKKKIDAISRAESNSRNNPYFMNYDAILRDVSFALGNLKTQMGIDFTPEEYDEIMRFVDPKLKTVGANDETS